MSAALCCAAPCRAVLPLLPPLLSHLSGAAHGGASHFPLCAPNSQPARLLPLSLPSPLPFWASWVLFQGLLAALEACLLVGFGYAFGFKLVRPCSGGAVCQRLLRRHWQHCQCGRRGAKRNSRPSPPPRPLQ